MQPAASSRPRIARVLLALALAAAAAVGVAGFALASGARPAANRAVTVKSAANASVGKTILVDSRGRTLYRRTGERRGHILCKGSCAALWPPVLVPRGAHLKAGKGVKRSRLGTVRLAGGKRAAAYRGAPLRRFTGDAKRGDATGDGVDGIWHVIAVHAAAPAPEPAPSPGPYGY
jgi:predicted lipoprotein with Yx(FWY)xxD motif